MFVRKKKNPSGVISVQVIDKSQGKYRVVKTIGSSSDLSIVEALYREGLQWISDYLGQLDIFDNYDKEIEEEQVVTHLISNIEHILLNGTQLILDRVFHLVGFDRIEDEVFKHLVIARICQPSSKSATVEYLKSYFDEDLKLHNIY